MNYQVLPKCGLDSIFSVIFLFKSRFYPLLKSVCGVEAVARITRNIQVVKEEEMNILLDEWKMYQADEIPER